MFINSAFINEGFVLQEVYRLITGLCEKVCTDECVNDIKLGQCLCNFTNSITYEGMIVYLGGRGYVRGWDYGGSF